MFFCFLLQSILCAIIIIIAFAYYSESDDSPGMYFNVGGPVELRAPTMERAALYLDMALSQISNHAYAPATVFTLHVYQYNLEQQGKRECTHPSFRLSLSGNNHSPFVPL